MKRLNCILLVDDNHPTNVLNKKLIEKLGIANTIKVAENGERAIEYLLNCIHINGEEYPGPDLIFLDINMPRMNGWEFLEAYREKNFHSKHRANIFMLTTSPNPDDEVKASQMPEISGFIKKPLTQQTLNEVILNYFGS